MSEVNRSVDRAMDEERNEKATIRALWLQEVQEYVTQFPGDEGPVYLTLSGAEGRDIRLLAEHGLVGLTEVGGIVERDKGKLVAVEASSPAVARLQRSFPNLKILEVWTYPASVDTFSSRSVRFPQSNLFELSRA